MMFTRDSFLSHRYGERKGLNIVELNATAKPVQTCQVSGNRAVALRATDLRRCRGSADLIVSTHSQQLVKGSSKEKQQALDTAWQALGPQGELVLVACNWKSQEREIKTAILKRFDYVTQHDFDCPDKSVVILRKRG